LLFQLIQVYKISGKSRRKLPEIVERRSSEDSPPPVMLQS
jgi:hypothetical protein